DPRFAGRAWPRRDDDVRGSELLDLLERRGVVPSYDGLLPQLLHVTRQVVHEGVVVVDEQDHGSRAAIRPRALSSVSRYSCAGSESATIPPPALKYTRPPRATAVRMAMLVSSAPVTLKYPMAPQYTPRSEGSSSAMISIARTFGAPVIEPPGK